MPHSLAGPFARFRPFVAGGGTLDLRAATLRLTIPPTGARRYADAQIDDYHSLRRSRFPWRPPLRMSVRARMSHESSPRHLAEHPERSERASFVTRHSLQGTAGFGFWNDPFTLTGGGVVAAPNVVWFFYASPPSNMTLVEGVPGWGWKAAVINSSRVPGIILAPAALIAALLTKVPGLGRRVIAAARRAMRVSEAILPQSMTEWHTYELEWREREAIFWVDGVETLRAPDPPRGPLGFVAWVDNQYAIATPQGRFGFGMVETTEPQWIELESVSTLRVTPDGVKQNSGILELVEASNHEDTKARRPQRKTS
ncbi:MAG: hypothetical protein HY023_13485 [Chloroflexi bacterium]|nr:hypothetical protein [Chloroflexota bacterium]